MVDGVEILLRLVAVTIAYIVMRGLVMLIVNFLVGKTEASVGAAKHTALGEFLDKVLLPVFILAGLFLVADSFFKFGSQITTIGISGIAVFGALYMGRSSSNSNWSAALSFMISNPVEINEYVFLPGHRHELKFSGLNSIYELIFLNKNAQEVRMAITDWPPKEGYIKMSNTYGSKRCIDFPLPYNINFCQVEAVLKAAVMENESTPMEGVAYDPEDDVTLPTVFFQPEVKHGYIRAELRFWVDKPSDGWELCGRIFAKGAMLLGNIGVGLVAPSTYWFDEVSHKNYVASDIECYNPPHREKSKEIKENSARSIYEKLKRPAEKVAGGAHRAVEGVKGAGEGVSTAAKNTASNALKTANSAATHIPGLNYAPRTTNDIIEDALDDGVINGSNIPPRVSEAAKEEE